MNEKTEFNDIKKIQTEVVKRAMEIKEKSKKFPSFFAEKTNEPSYNHSTICKNPHQENNSHNINQNSEFLASNAPNLFNILFKDPDKTLIMALILILMDNDENFTLILALFYTLI